MLSVIRLLFAILLCLDATLAQPQVPRGRRALDLDKRSTVVRQPYVQRVSSSRAAASSAAASSSSKTASLTTTTRCVRSSGIRGVGRAIDLCFSFQLEDDDDPSASDVFQSFNDVGSSLDYYDVSREGPEGEGARLNPLRQCVRRTTTSSRPPTTTTTPPPTTTSRTTMSTTTTTTTTTSTTTTPACAASYRGGPFTISGTGASAFRPRPPALLFSL